MLFDNYERYKTDTDHHIIKKQSNKKEKNMKKKGTKIIVNFLIRGIIGFAIIFFVNEFLDGQGISEIRCGPCGSFYESEGAGTWRTGM